NKEINEDTFNIKPSGFYEESKYETKGYIKNSNSEEYIAVKKRKIQKWLIGLLILLLVGASVLFATFLGGNAIDPNAGDYESGLKRPANITSSQILVPGYEKWTLKEGQDTIQTVLYNPEGNPCFFKFSLVEKASGELLYESKLVPPGQGISPVKMKRGLSRGSYTLVLKIESFDLEDKKTQYNGTDIELEVNVTE
ncbi:MAG: hypothetical protein RSA71_08120, partial [Eubacterium sp.]